MSWNDITDASSDVTWYDLDVSVDSGDWESLLANTQSTSYQYPDVPGHEYTFRVTATDRVGNVGQGQASAIVTAVTKYYYFGSKRVAMRGPDETVVWLHGDHLGSTSLATDAAGEALSRQLYYPFGEQRWSSAGLPTDFQFTGQRNQSTIALYDYHARFYNPYVGRFIQADTIVPSPGNPQHFNRYSYVSNNPLAFTDPGGHYECGPACEGEGGDEPEYAKGFHRPWWYDSSSGWGSGWGAGFTFQDVENTAIMLGILVAAMAAPEIIVGLGETAAAAPGTIATIIKTTPPQWLAALLGKAIVEEAVEANMTGTPFNPALVGLDLLTQFGDDFFLPMRSRMAFGVGGGGGPGLDEATGARGLGDIDDLISPQRRTHILDGDATGGGHRAGTGKPGKSEFPASWSDDDIIYNVLDVATDPASTVRPGRGGRTLVSGTRDGIDILAVLENPATGYSGVVTAFPTNVRRNPR